MLSKVGRAHRRQPVFCFWVVEAGQPSGGERVGRGKQLRECARGVDGGVKPGFSMSLVVGGGDGRDKGAVVAKDCALAASRFESGRGHLDKGD